MALISQADLEARIGRSLTASEASSFTVINAAIQAHIEEMIGSSVESVNETTRYYDGGVQNLPIDPCTNISAVKYVDADTAVEYTFDTSDYTTEPVNTTCKWMLRNRYAKFARGFNNVSVSAKFSIYADTRLLGIVKDAILSSIESELSNSDNIQRESIEGYSVEYASAQTKASLAKLESVFPRII